MCSRWSDANFSEYMLNTVIVTVATVALVVIRCAMAGYVLARRRFLGHRTVLIVLVGTLFVPAGYTIIPVVEITQRLGLLNSLGGIDHRSLRRRPGGRGAALHGLFPGHSA